MKLIKKKRKKSNNSNGFMGKILGICGGMVSFITTLLPILIMLIIMVIVVLISGVAGALGGKQAQDEQGQGGGMSDVSILSSGFAEPVKGAHINPEWGTYGWFNGRAHTGIDFVSLTGDKEAVAPMDGKIIQTWTGCPNTYPYPYFVPDAPHINPMCPVNGSLPYFMADGGNRILIQFAHPDDDTKDMVVGFNHLNDVYVKTGQEVKRGEIVGTIGNTGYSFGDHFHITLNIIPRGADGLTASNYDTLVDPIIGYCGVSGSNKHPDCAAKLGKE